MADVNYWIDGRISTRQVIAQFNQNTCYSHYNSKDKKPFKYYIKNPVILIFKIVIKRILNVLGLYKSYNN